MDINSLEWKIISEYLEDRLQWLREKNDGNLSLDNTNVVRGQIKEVKSLLKLPEKQMGSTSDRINYVD